MKYSFVFILLLFSAANVFGQKGLREIDLKVNGIGSGSSEAAVVRRFGKPLRRRTERIAAPQACSGENETHSTLVYKKLEIMLLRAGCEKVARVYGLEMSSARWLASGVKIGSSVKDLTRKFGQPNSRGNDSGATILYYVTRDNLGTVSFHVKNNKVVKILMNETLC